MAIEYEFREKSQFGGEGGYYFSIDGSGDLCPCFTIATGKEAVERVYKLWIENEEELRAAHKKVLARSRPATKEDIKNMRTFEKITSRLQKQANVEDS